MAEKTVPRFIFSSAPSIIAWPCTISVPMDGGGRQDQSITARFQMVPGEELRVISEAKGDIAALEAIIVGFENLDDSSGDPVPFERAKATLFKLPYCVIGFLTGYYEMVGGRLAKN